MNFLQHVTMIQLPAGRFRHNPYGIAHAMNAPACFQPPAPDEHISCRPRDAPPAQIFTAEDKSSLYFPRDGRGPTENGVIPGTYSERSSRICSNTRATVPDTRSERSSTTSSPSRPARATVDPQLLLSTPSHANPVREVHSSPLTTFQTKDVPAMRPIYDAKILNAHGLLRFVVPELVAECSREPPGGDLRTYAQEIYVRNIPTGRHKLAGEVCKDLLSYIIGLLFWDAAEPARRFAFLKTNLTIQVSKRDPTSHVAEVVFLWSHSQGPGESSFDNIASWLSETLRTGVKNFGRRHRVLFDVDGVIWWGENPTNAAAHWRDLDRYLKENAELRQDETKKERSRRFGWMPLSYLIIKCHYVEPSPPTAAAKNRG